MESQNSLLYIFDKNENLLGILSNENRDGKIFFDDTFKKVLNGEWSYTFSVDLSKTKDMVLEYNKVGFYDSRGDFQLFTIMNIDDEFSSEATRKVFCLHDYQDINEIIIENGVFKNESLYHIMQSILSNSTYKCGKIADINDINIDVSMTTTLSAINELIKTLELELYFRLELNESNTEIVNRYIDLVGRVGVNTNINFDFSNNLEKIKRKIDNNFFTVLYGKGKQLEDGTYATMADAVWNKGTNPEDKPKGQLWIGDSEAIAKYGIRAGIYSNQNISIPDTLINRTYEKLLKVNRPKINYEANVYDLSSIAGYEHMAIYLGDSFNIIDDEYNIRESVRVIAEHESIIDEIEKKVELGDPRDSITDIVDNVESGQGEVIDKINKIKIEIDEELGQITIDIKDDIKGLQTQITANTEGISSKVSNGEFESYKTQTANQIASKVSAVDVSSLIQQNPGSVQIGFNGINDVIEMTKDGLKVKHGSSYSMLSGSGLKRHNGSTSEDYHYLTHVVGFTTTADTGSLKWIQLPSEFKGKKFGAYATLSDTWEGSWDYGEPWVIQRMVAFVKEVDYANARVGIQGYRTDKNYNTGAHRHGAIAGMLFVIA